MEKKPRLVAGDGGGDGGGGGGEASCSVGGGLVDRLPEALLVEVVGRLGLEAACSAAASCRALRAAAAASFSTVTSLDLSGFPPTNAIVNRILAGNGALRSLTVNCSLLDDSAVAAFAKGSLRELSLLKCSFSPYLFVAISERCTELRSFMVEMATSDGSEHFVICRKSIAHIFKGCGYLENLSLKFPLLAPGSVDFESLLPIIPSTIKVLLLQPMANWQAKRLFPTSASLKTSFSDSLGSLSLVLDIITDELVAFITKSLRNLVELCLEDNPMSEEHLHNDLTNVGLQALGLCQNLTHLSLTRGKQNYSSTFRRVNDFGILMLAEGCKQLKTIRLAGFSKVRDAGYAALLHSCKDLKKFEVSTGSCLSDLTCLDLDEAAPKITEVRLLCCGLLTSETAISLSSCTNLEVLDLSGCRSIADSGLVSISQLSKLTLLDLAGADITDVGLSALGNGRCPISSLCLRGCRRISNNGIASLLCGSGTINKTLATFDIGNVPRISGRAVTLISKNCEQISSLCLRNCLLITDSSLEILGSTWKDSGKSSLRMLDLSYCYRLSRNFLRLFEPPLFRGLRWLGVGKNVLERRGSSPTVAELLGRKPGLTICSNACEMGCTNQCHRDIRIQ